MPTVLVTDGEQRAALAIVRSLGRAGYRCIVCSGSGRSLAGASRFAAREMAVPDAGAEPARYADAVAAIVAAEQVDLLMPVSESSLLALLPERARLGAVVPFAELETVQAICDKERVLTEAQAVGIRVPKQVEIRCPEQVVAPDLRYPVVLKPARSVFTAADGTRGKTTVRWVRQPEDMRPTLQAFPAAAYPILAQEAVEGPGIGIFVLMQEGRVTARFAHRRLREKPPSGGVSVLRQSEPLDDELLARSVALLERFDWSGVAMIEYKRDRTTGDAYLMEINGRFWGSLQLAIDAGVDFPRLLADVALGRAPAPVESYRFARSRWFWGDVDHVIAVWRDRRFTGRDRLAAVAGCVRAFGPGYNSEVMQWSDPRPFARESAQWLTNILRH